MPKRLSILLRSFISLFRTRGDLAFENLLLRRQLAVLKDKGVRPRLSPTDRSFWALASKLWPRWRNALYIVKPETVIRWHREGIRRHWARKCRQKGRQRMSGSHDHSRRAALATNRQKVRGLLQQSPHAPFSRKGCAEWPASSISR